MRIAVVNNFFPPRPGGSSHLAAALAAGYVAAGHEVLVVTAAYRGLPAEEERDGYRVVRLPALPMPQLGLAIDFDLAFALARPGNLRRVFRLLDEFQPEVIHQHGQFFDLSWISGWYARRRKVPVLLSIHTRLESPDPKYALLFRGLDRFLVRPIIRRFHPRYVIMDELAATYCTQRYRATEADFEYIPVAVDPDRFEEQPTLDVRARHGLGDQPLIVSLGHVIPLRDRLALVEALPAVLERHPTAKVMIVGQVYYDAFARRAAELGVQEAIIATGPVPSSEVPAYFAAADIVAHDLQGGGFGTASLEAMAAGRATIGTVTETNFPAVRLHNWENFVLARPNDPADLATAIVRLLDDPQERQWIAKQQQDLVYSHFTMDVVTRQHLTAFERMVGVPA
ncbi:glucosyltransferase [Micromonospora rosaria]|uniref:Glucosyltransferase n=1 Tax=Micromonospora rosaria TaxID=47874 RepID=A0A136PRG0_9ACTN|nr:glycosyltransferase family 4 protein [Micromonospora rosaria]KXK61023.1 glucosyltransferase [Micromonospora rosaria]